jgi:predicted GIY-YIG superfamily endonuclease
LTTIALPPRPLLDSLACSFERRDRAQLASKLRTRIIRVMPQYYCYILECIDGSLYTGLTKDPERRLYEHLAGRGGRYTRSHPPRSLGYLEALPDLGPPCSENALLRGTLAPASWR